MIVVRIAMNVPSENQKELVQTLLSMLGLIEKESGCMSCALFCDIEDKNLLILCEEWQARKDLDLHFQSELFGVLLGAKSLLNEPHAFQIYTVHKSEGTEAVHAIRRKKRSVIP